jgi:predicted RNA-binding Zn-ribbon protein involved in translation (DUF1610 family)
VENPPTCGKPHQQLAPPSFALLPIGSTNGLEFEHHREVSSVSGKVMLSHQGNATFVCPITGQHSLLRNSDIRSAIDPPYG